MGRSGISRTTSTMNHYAQAIYLSNRNPLVTTLCDGVPRQLENQDTRIVVTMTNGSASVLSTLPKAPTPTCRIQQEHCRTLRSGFDQITSSMSSSYSSSMNSRSGYPSSWPVPELGVYSLTPPSRTEPDCGDYCALDGYQVSLKSPSDDSCHRLTRSISPLCSIDRRRHL
jgi:hypothetical protein